MKNLILTIASVIISLVSFSQLSGMDQYKSTKSYKFKDGKKGHFDLFGDRNYYFVNSDSVAHVEELVRIAEVNGVDLDDLSVNTYIESIESNVETFISDKGLIVTIIRTRIK